LSASYVIESNLSEKQIEADVAKYFGWCAWGLPFDLRDVDEPLTGADKLSNVTVPIYAQFKKSTGLRRPAAPLLRRRANESPLQDIRRFRALHDLPNDPALFFQLRKKASGASDLQHNVLLEHHKPPISYAIYVAPLYLDYAEYCRDLFRDPRFRDDPWYWEKTELLSDWRMRAWLSRFDLQPFLRGHVSIPPHCRVSDHHHHYAYSLRGDSITWHSGEVVDPGSSRLSDFMSRRTRDLLSPGYELPAPEQCIDLVRRNLASADLAGRILEGDGPVAQLQAYGRWLWREHGIRQLLLLGRRDELEKVRSLRG
jgi:hypothetical protein